MSMAKPDSGRQRGDVAVDACRLLFERVDTMACTLDLEGRFTSVNSAGERLTGYTSAELFGRYAVELIAPELREEAVRQFQQRLRGGGAGAADESLLLTRDARRIPIEVSSILFEADGRPVGVLGLVRDLTERRKAAEALEQIEERFLESEQRFRRSFESAATGMALVSIEGRLLQVNESLCELLGYSAEELLVRTFQEITHPDDVELYADDTRRLLAGEIRSYTGEKRYVHRDGSIVWALLSVSLATMADGTPLHFVSQIQDITQRQLALAALERSEAQLGEAQAMARIGSWEYDLETGEVALSRELQRLYEMDGADATAERLRARIHPDDLDAALEAVSRSENPGESVEIEFRIRRNDGIRWIASRSVPVVRDGVVVGRRGTAQDITDRKESEQRLAEAERRYRTLVEQLPLVTYVRPLDMSIPNIYVSPQVEAMLGYPASEWESNPGLLAGIVHPEDREHVLADARRVRAGGAPIRDEYRYITPDGGIVWVQDETYVVCDPEGEPLYVQGFLLDITERKRAEAERDRLRDELHHAQKLEAVGRLAGGVAHDFNNMLTAIKGYGELLVVALAPGTASHEHASQIVRAAEQAAVLPQQLLAFGRKQALEPRLIDLNEVVLSASRLLRHVLTDAVELVTMPVAIPAHAFVDPSRIEHVLLNLAVNARDAMPDGGTVTIATRSEDVAVATAVEHGVGPGAYVVLSVADTGVGMDEATLERAFEPFFTTKARGEGSGLGLASVYGTVSQSGGFVQARSEPGVGTTVEIHLPCASGAACDAGAGEKRPRSILLAEDELLVQRLAADVLGSAGFDVTVACDGERALELYERHGGSFDALVTDLVMPGLGGRELSERLAERNPDLPVLFLSGYSEEIAAGALNGAHSFLPKPFSPPALVEAVRRVTTRYGADGCSGPAKREELLTCVVADDHPAVLDSVSSYLESRGIRVSRARSGEEALEQIEALRPEIAVLDVAMGSLGGIDVARRIAEVSPDTLPVVYTGARDRSLLERAVDAGARGVVLKEAALPDLERAIRAVAAGDTYVPAELSSALTAASGLERQPLTAREQEVLRLVADGLTNEKVASRLGISPETVQSHVRHAMEKLEADTRTEAVAKALRLALIV